MMIKRHLNKNRPRSQSICAQQVGASRPFYTIDRDTANLYSLALITDK